jgi:CHAT domain-containing protein
MVFFSACGPATEPLPPPAPLTAYEEDFQDSLSAMTQDYAELQLWEALASARRLRARMEAGPDTMRGALRAEVYQYLGMVHFDRMVHIDSVATYTAWAENLLGINPSLDMQGRQLLCRALTHATRWEWLDMELTAYYGTELLRSNQLTDLAIYPQLLLTRAIARKKHADTHLKGAVQQAAYQQSKEWMELALDQFQAQSSLREWQAFEEYVILQTRLDDSDWTAERIRSELVGSERQSSYALPDRVFGYWHNRFKLEDRAVMHYRNLAKSADTIFTNQQLLEANYILRRDAARKQRYEQAIFILSNEMRRMGCCASTSVPEEVSPIAQCLEKAYCTIYMGTLAKMHFGLYQRDGDGVHLKEASRLVMRALNQFDEAYTEAKEEGALNNLFEMGSRVLDAAMEITYARARERPTPEHLQDVFLAMEQGKMLLLLREASSREKSPEKLAKRKQVKEQLDRFRRTYSDHGELPLADLLKYQALSRRYDQLRLRPDSEIPPPEEPGRRLTANLDIRPRLPESPVAGQAIFELTDAGDRTYAYYRDADTVCTFLVSEDLDSLTEQFTSLLTSGASDIHRYVTVATDLYLGLLGPVADHALKNQELLFVPSIRTSGLPIAALTVAATDTTTSFSELDYVIDHLDVRYLPSYRMETNRTAWRKERTDQKLNIGVWTHAQLQAYLGGLGDRLVRQGTARSAHFRGESSNKATFVTQAPDFSIIHLSAHAFSNPEQLHQNYLLLNTGDSLRGTAVAAMTLPARLVVLAACSTAKGYARPGEGNLSLLRSFYLAGVPDVVSSIYDLPASATATILDAFYTSYFKEPNSARALNGACRLARRGEFGSRYTHPGYWAGLVAG